MKKKIFALSLLGTPFLVLASSCNVAVSTSGDKKDNDKKEGNKNNNDQPSGKPLIRESLTLDQKKEKVKEYFKNYDYVVTDPGAFTIYSTKNEEKEEWKADINQYLWNPQKTHQTKVVGFVVNADIYSFLQDLKWKLSIQKAKNSNELTFYLEDELEGKNIETYHNEINYFVSPKSLNPKENPSAVVPSYFLLGSYGNRIYLDKNTSTLLPENEFKKSWLPETLMTSEEGSEKIWDTLKWYDDLWLLKAAALTSFSWFKMIVKKYSNENRIEWFIKLPLTYFEKNEKGVYVEANDKDHPKKFENLIQYRTVSFDKLKFQDVAQKLAKINKTTFSPEQFAQASVDDPLEITSDNRDTLKEKLGLVLNDSITFDELGSDGKFIIKKAGVDFNEHPKFKDQKYGLYGYQWTFEKNGESYTYSYYMQDFNSKSS